MSTIPTIVKPLKAPWKLAGQDVTEIELRAPLVEDMLAAEEEANPGLQPMKYQVALAAQTMVRAGTSNGPFAAAQFKKMTPANFAVLREALAEAGALGEG